MSGRYPEVERMAREIVISQELRALLSNRRQSNDEAEEGRENGINLMDIFVLSIATVIRHSGKHSQDLDIDPNKRQL